MSFHLEHSISPRDLAQVLLRHKRKMCVWALVVVGLSFVTLKFLPRKYSSEAKLFVRLGRESVTLDPTATTGQTLQVQETRENQINSARDMLTSRALLEDVVASVGADAILRDSLDESSEPGVVDKLKTAAGTTLRWVISMPRVSPQEEAVDKLLKSISVKVGRNSSVIDFSCESKQPQLAQRILQAFLDAYREQHRAANRTDGTLAFFEEQAGRLKEQLDVAAVDLRDAKNESGLVSLPAQQKSLQEQLTLLETASFTAESALASSLASIDSLRAALGELPLHVPTQQTAGFANTAADNMQHDYFKLRILLRDLESRLGEEHPQVQDMREQVRQSETLLSATAPERTQSTLGLHPSRQSLDLDLRREEALAASLRAKAGTLKDQVAALEQRTHELNQHEVRITVLERQLAIGETSYRSYMDHLEQARIGDALDTNRISNVNVVQSPTLVEKPVSPKPALVLGVGLILAVAGAFGLAFGANYLEHSLKTPTEVAAQLDLGVLAPVPRPPRHEAFVN